MPSLYKIIFLSFAVLIFAGFFLILWSMAGSYSLGWDEAVYLSKARSWIEGTPADTFGIYRPIGMPAIGWAIIHLSADEKNVRVFGVALGALALAFIFLLFGRAVNMLVALSIVVLIGASPLFLREAPQFLNDIPSSGFLFLILALIWNYYKSPDENISIYFAPLFAAISFYLRYGVVLQLAIIGLLSLILFFKKMSRENSLSSKVGIKALAISAVLASPHFIYSLYMTGNPFGILIAGSEAAGRAYLGEGLIQYMKWLPNKLAGPIVGAFAIAGMITTLGILSRKNLRNNYKELLWLGGIGISSFILTGILVHAEGRYIFFPLVLLAGVGVSGLYYFLGQKLVLRDFLMVAIAVAAIYPGILSYREVYAFYREQEKDPARNAYIQAYKFIKQETFEERNCMVWTTQFFPQVSWYSKCNVSRIADLEKFRKYYAAHPKKIHYSIAYSKLKDVQISPLTSERFSIKLAEIYSTRDFPESSGLGKLSIYKIEPYAAGTSSDL